MHWCDPAGLQSDRRVIEKEVGGRIKRVQMILTASCTAGFLIAPIIGRQLLQPRAALSRPR